MSTPNGHGEVASNGRSLRWDAEDVARMCEGFKRTGGDRWVACCPAHADKTPSLAIRNGNNGGVLLYCFAGCEIEAIVGALGLQVSDLMPERAPGDYKPQKKLGVHPADALIVLDIEALVILAAIRKIQAGETLSDEDAERVSLASKHISAVREISAV